MHGACIVTTGFEPTALVASRGAEVGVGAKISKASEHHTYVWEETAGFVRHFCRGRVQSTEKGKGSVVSGCKGSTWRFGEWKLWIRVEGTTSSRKCEAVPRRACIQGSYTFASLNSRLESDNNKKNKFSRVKL